MADQNSRDERRARLKRKNKDDFGVPFDSELYRKMSPASARQALLEQQKKVQDEQDLEGEEAAEEARRRIRIFNEVDEAIGFNRKSVGPASQISEGLGSDRGEFVRDILDRLGQTERVTSAEAAVDEFLNRGRGNVNQAGEALVETIRGLVDSEEENGSTS